MKINQYKFCFNHLIQISFFKKYVSFIFYFYCICKNRYTFIFVPQSSKQNYKHAKPASNYISQQIALLKNCANRETFAVFVFPLHFIGLVQKFSNFLFRFIQVQKILVLDRLDMIFRWILPVLVVRKKIIKRTLVFSYMFRNTEFNTFFDHLVKYAFLTSKFSKNLFFTNKGVNNL